MISWNSFITFLSALPLIAAIPKPSTNAINKAVITSSAGGIRTSKNGSKRASDGSVESTVKLPTFKKVGNTIEDVKYARDPNNTVDPYAIPAVIASSFPAPSPKSPIPGATNPIIIRGIANPKKLPKIPLNVAKNRTTGSGKNVPTSIPIMIAIINLGNKPSFFKIISS